MAQSFHTFYAKISREHALPSGEAYFMAYLKDHAADFPKLSAEEKAAYIMHAHKNCANEFWALQTMHDNGLDWNERATIDGTDMRLADYIGTFNLDLYMHRQGQRDWRRFFESTQFPLDVTTPVYHTETAKELLQDIVAMDMPLWAILARHDFKHGNNRGFKENLAKGKQYHLASQNAQPWEEALEPLWLQCCYAMKREKDAYLPGIEILLKEGVAFHNDYAPWQAYQDVYINADREKRAETGKGSRTLEILMEIETLPVAAMHRVLNNTSTDMAGDFRMAVGGGHLPALAQPMMKEGRGKEICALCQQLSPYLQQKNAHSIAMLTRMSAAENNSALNQWVRG